MAVSKNVTQILWMKGPQYEIFSPGRQLSLSHARNLSVCAELQHVDGLVQSKPFLQIKPLRVASLHQDCMNIDMQLINRPGWRGSPKWA